MLVKVVHSICVATSLISTTVWMTAVFLGLDIKNLLALPFVWPHNAIFLVCVVSPLCLFWAHKRFLRWPLSIVTPASYAAVMLGVQWLPLKSWGATTRSADVEYGMMSEFMALILYPLLMWGFGICLTAAGAVAQAVTGAPLRPGLTIALFLLLAVAFVMALPLCLFLLSRF